MLIKSKRQEKKKQKQAEKDGVAVKGTIAK